MSAEVGAASISVDYGRPDLGGRMLSELLGMLPEDRVWRAGENQVTILETSAPVMIGAETIPGGPLQPLSPHSGRAATGTCS